MGRSSVRHKGFGSFPKPLQILWGLPNAILELSDNLSWLIDSL